MKIMAMLTIVVVLSSCSETPVRDLSREEQQALDTARAKLRDQDLSALKNPKGDGVFVFVPESERPLLWVVLDGEVYPLNAPSKHLNPHLLWPRQADPEDWGRTGLSPYMATDAIEIVFGSDRL